MATFFFRINHELCIATFLSWGESKCLWDVKEQNSISKKNTFQREQVLKNINEGLGDACNTKIFLLWASVIIKGMGHLEN